MKRLSAAEREAKIAAILDRRYSWSRLKRIAQDSPERLQSEFMTGVTFAERLAMAEAARLALTSLPDAALTAQHSDVLAERQRAAESAAEGARLEREEHDAIERAARGSVGKPGGRKTAEERTAKRIEREKWGREELAQLLSKPATGRLSAPKLSALLLKRQRVKPWLGDRAMCELVRKLLKERCDSIEREQQ